MTDQFKFGDLMYSAGTVVLCADGHEICDINRDLHKGDLEYADAFVNWREGQKVPNRGDLTPLLCSCGAAWFSKHNLVNWR